jgi:hypothetical protein
VVKQYLARSNCKIIADSSRSRYRKRLALRAIGR